MFANFTDLSNSFEIILYLQVVLNLFNAILHCHFSVAVCSYIHNVEYFEACVIVGVPYSLLPFVQLVD
jgi:hypothetical protein